MLRLRVIVGTLTIWMFFLSFLRVLSLLSPSLSPLCRRLHVRSPVPEAGHPPGCNGTCRASPPLTPPALYSGKHWNFCTEQDGLRIQKGKTKESGDSALSGPVGFRELFSEERPVSSSAPRGLWGHSLFSFLNFISNAVLVRSSRNTLTRQSPHHSLPQVQNVSSPSSFSVNFRKCAQVNLHADPPQLTFFLLIHNTGSAGGANLFQMVIRDSVSGITPIRTDGRVVERGFQMFAIDSLKAGSHVSVNYTAFVRSHKSEVLELPAFLTFSNASQNDICMFGPLQANLTLRLNSSDAIYPNHRVHFAGFAAGFFVALVLLSLGFLAMNLAGSTTALSLLQQRRNRGDSDPEYADCSMSEAIKDEATFEDKMVDVMVLEEPHNMYQALENIEMSTLLRATSNLELIRIQIYKDVMSCLLGGLRSQGQTSSQAHQRLLSVLHGQLLGMEGRLKEERGERMAALAGHCNLETREEMEAEHHREAAEKARAERLCQHADQQELLRCSVLLEKLHKLSQSRLQRALLVRHEEASAKVQRQIVERRRVELHKIFSEELEEAVRMGELEKSAAQSLQHKYFTCQDELEEVLDVVLANQRYVLSERSAQRRFLVHSLHSLNGLISDSFSSTSSSLDSWFTHIRRGSLIPAEQMEQLQEKAQKELVTVRQRLDETLNQERRAMRCGLIKRRRELISGMVMLHKQRQRDLSSGCRDQEETVDVGQHLRCWRDLLTSHSLELAELINNLDEEAAADIRKMTMGVIQGALAEAKTIQPSAAQAMLALLPPGAKLPSVPPEPEVGPRQATAQGTSAVLQGQDRLHQEGKAALRTLSCTREALQRAMEEELQQQKELRKCCRDFFSRLCLSQLSLSEEDRLRMKLEFQKCLSVIDRCLVLPHAVSRTKLHTAMAAWRKKGEEQMTSNGKACESRKKTDDLLLFQTSLQERIQLFEQEKEMETGLMEQVLEEMQKERSALLRSQTDGLAVQMATIHYQKAERWTTLLEASGAALSLQSLLIQLLRERKHLEKQELAQLIQSHCQDLQEAEQHLEKDELQSCESGVPSGRSCHKEPEEEECSDEDEQFQLRSDAMMTTVLQEALHKCERVLTLMTERFLEMSTNHQSVEDSKEAMELKRLRSLCDLDLEFTSQLVKQTHVSTATLQEVLRLLLPALPESQLLSLSDAVYPKHSAEQEHSGFPGDVNAVLPVKLRGDVVQKNAMNVAGCAVEAERLQEQRRSLMEKLLPSSTRLPSKDTEAPLTEGKGKQGRLLKTPPPPPEHQQQVKLTSAEELDSAAEERLFVFRDPPEADRDQAQIPKRPKKRNFLNLKKSSVAPADFP
ncbi:limbin isoform X2 [Oryzias melastigma]|uniref:limbin isoform X2 n=1 Tax=Oryzias melastigma TaxID=30732 RepID=UPI000CF81DEF|nr:limbin isoform X2 [Oryzias melastigma]